MAIFNQTNSYQAKSTHKKFLSGLRLLFFLGEILNQHLMKIYLNKKENCFYLINCHLH